MTRRLAAIMFTDVAGYTALSQRDEPTALRLLQDQDRLARGLLEVHRGRLVKSIGDGLLIEFANALDAVECAVDLQRHIQERNGREPPPDLRVRIGIHLGDVEEVGSDILGDAVNVASRIEPLADPGGVCLSEPVYGQVRHKVPFQLEELGPKTLKGVQEPLAVYRIVVPERAAAGATPVTAPLPLRLAVLPLANISQDPKDEYFADGLTEELIGALAQVKGLRVISRTSVNQYRATTKSIAQIGSELGAGWILEGSVRRWGDQLRISVQLIDSRSDEHVWSQTYDRKLEGVFTVQGEVAERTAAALRLKLTPSGRESVRSASTPSIEAWDCYLKGVYFAAQGGKASTEEAIRWFGKATSTDPSFGIAYAWWGYLYALAAGWDFPGNDAFPRAKELIAQARQLAPEALETHVASGVLALRGDLDWPRAETEFLAATSINPSHAPSHFWLGVTRFTIGRFPSAVDDFRTTIQLDPQNSDAWSWLKLATYLSGDLETALTLAELQCNRDPSVALYHAQLAFLYAMAGRHTDARREAALMTGDLSAWSRVARAGFFAWAGEPQEARALVVELEERARTSYVPLMHLAILYLALGENERGLDLIERDEREGDHLLWFYYWLDWCDGVRTDPRFVAMLRRRGLPETVGTPRFAHP